MKGFYNMEKSNKRRKWNKYNKKLFIIFIMTGIFISTIIFISGRYVVNSVRETFSKSKEFYFYSDKLSKNNPSYQIENWSGIDNYVITINMSSRENNLVATSYDINYNISYIASSNIICQLSKQSGTIYSTTNTDSFTLIITPNATFHNGDRVFVEITAKTTAPYEKTLKGRFTLVVGQEQFSYTIEDSANSPYLMLNMTNTLSYYKVAQAFGTYSIGDRINIETYLTLTEADKQKCYSKIITLTFDPNDVVLDMTDDNYLNRLSITSTTKNSYNYINSLSFKIDALSSVGVRFYKMNQEMDYTYPGSSNPIITVTNI